MDRNNQILLATAITTVVMMMAAKQKFKCRERRRARIRKSIKRMAEEKLDPLPNDTLLTENPSLYQNLLRMDRNLFEKLFKKVRVALTKEDTFMKESISARRKLEATLLFLATGEAFRSLMVKTKIHESTISKFIPIVCDAIYRFLKDEYLKTPNDKAAWHEVAKEFEELWQFPNCLGVIDGRHINFKAPISAGSDYYNYKGNHSIVLLGMVDATYKFIYYNVGVQGKINDGCVYRESRLSKAIVSNSLDFPEDQALPGQTVNVPYVILADDAFPLSNRLMKPYPSEGLTNRQKYFNCRLSRVKHTIESTFGLLVNRFQILMNPINLSPEKVEKITLACIALHNFLATENWKPYTEHVNEYTCKLSNVGVQEGNQNTDSALQIRDTFKNYFNSEAGVVEWRDNEISQNNI